MTGSSPPGAGADPLVGRDLGPNYRLVRRIGAGGMGAVYEARHRGNGSRAAVKVLNKELVQDATLLERFRREAKITASLRNPHVVRVLEFAEPPDGLPYLVMEYLEGEDLESRLKRLKRLDLAQASEVLRCLSIALTEAHAAGVVHRDLKPANVFFAKEGAGERVKLLDFGLSKALRVAGEGLTFFGQLLGTVYYMSPEQTRGEEASSASDIYALGVLVYQALTGEFPYAAETPHEYLFRIQKDTPRPLAQVAPDLPVALEPMLLRAMAKLPAERYPSVRAFADEFAELVNMGGDSTNVVRADSALGRALAAPVPPPPAPAAPRGATDPKLRAAPRAATDPKLRSAPAPKTPSGSVPRVPSDPKIRAAESGAAPRSATDPKLRAAPPVTNPRTRTAPPLAMVPVANPGQAAAQSEIPPTVISGSTYRDDSTVVRPLPENLPPPVDEPMDSTVVRPLPTEDSTRVVPAPLPLAPDLARTAPPVAATFIPRPTTDPAERTSPGGPGGRAPYRDIAEDDSSEMTSPGQLGTGGPSDEFPTPADPQPSPFVDGSGPTEVPAPPPRSPTARRDLATTIQNKAPSLGGEQDENRKALMLGVGIGLGVGAVLLVGGLLIYLLK